MKLSTAIKTFVGKRAFLLERMGAMDANDPRWHGMNQEQRAIELVLPILESELQYRHALIASKGGNTATT